jgi:hypothetical protein
MESKVEYSTLMIELDALLDTRLAVIATMGYDKVETVLQSDYFKRKSDKFKDVDIEEFRTRYKNRDKTILKDAVVTPLAKMLKEFTEITNKNGSGTPFKFVPKIILNTFPYHLDQEESESILAAIRTITDGNCDLESVYMSYAELTPLYARKQLSVMILYAYDQWLEIQSELGNFNKTSCPEVTLFGPILKTNDTEQYIEGNPVEAIETLAKVIVNLKLITIDNFCLVVNPDRVT